MEVLEQDSSSFTFPDKGKQRHKRLPVVNKGMDGHIKMQ